MTAHWSRRTALTLGAGAALALVLPGHASAAPLTAGLRELEREHGARLGVFALDTGSGRCVRHRADELFPMTSVFKTLAAAAVLRRDRDGALLGKVIRYTQSEVDRSGYGPVTGRSENLANGMSVAALCQATIAHSDNAAGNLLLRELGGPTAITRFCRSLGDPVTRLDRWEPDLNSAEPGRRTDTTSPQAIGTSYARLVLGHALDRADAAQLTEWLLGNTTGGRRIRAGVPADWRVGDKTGTGRYGTTHDVGIAWPPGRAPIVLAVLSAKLEQAAGADDRLVARAAGLVAAALG